MLWKGDGEGGEGWPNMIIGCRLYWVPPSCSLSPLAHLFQLDPFFLCWPWGAGLPASERLLSCLRSPYEVQKQDSKLLGNLG